MNKVKHIVKSSILFILAVFFGLIVMEGYERFGEIESLSNFMVDSIHGKRLKPDVPLLYLNEGFYLGETNHYGYLGPDYTSENKENAFRVALIGDSYVEAFHVFDRNSFRAISENELNQFLNRKVEVLNFGRSGFVLSDMYVYYKNFASEFHPDKILVFVHDDDFFQQSYQSLLPTVKMQGDNIKIEKDFIKGSPFKNYKKSQFLRENSVFLKIANNCYKIYKDGLFDKIIFGKLSRLFTLKNKKQGSLSSQGKAPGNNTTEEIPLLNKQIIRTFAQDKKVYLVLADNPSAQVEQIIENSGIQTIRIFPALEELRKKGIDPNYWPATNKEGHWNHAAHKVIGELLAEKLSGRE